MKIDLGHLSFGQFLCTQPNWDGTEKRVPSATEAAIELSSPILHGLPLGKKSHLDMVMSAGYKSDSVTTDEWDNSFAAHLRHKREAAARAITAARDKLRRNPAPFVSNVWQPRHTQLAGPDWCIFLDTIYAAYIVSHATEATHVPLVQVATVTLNGGVQWVADALCETTGLGNPLLAQITSEALAAAAAFHEYLQS